MKQALSYSALIVMLSSPICVNAQAIDANKRENSSKGTAYVGVMGLTNSEYLG